MIVKYSAEVNDYTAINLTKLGEFVVRFRPASTQRHLTAIVRFVDILDDFKEVQIATGYSLNGKPLKSFPANLDVLASVEVTYKTMPGWLQPTTGAKTYAELPSNARNYIEFIEDFVGVKIRYIGTGPARESMITR